MHNAKVPILGFAAISGAGKTTLLTKLIPLLIQQQIRTGLIKHSHHNFQIDKPGKDSYKLRQAGASPIMLVSKYRRAVITEFRNPQDPRLEDQLDALDQSHLDLILVEGFKSENFPKIEVHRPELKNPLLYPKDPSIIAIASDTKLVVPEHIRQFDLNDPQRIAKYIITVFMGRSVDVEFGY
jgi:molybdopterin-guanine dinucleotide biosynthesis protein B